MGSCLKQPSTQPCWDCAKACGGCAWSARGEPIPGWDATERVLYHRGWKGQAKTTSFAIRYCPEFEPEVRDG